MIYTKRAINVRSLCFVGMSKHHHKKVVKSSLYRCLNSNLNTRFVSGVTFTRSSGR
jgi:hypothetical protein